MEKTGNDVTSAARMIWNYLQLGQPLRRVDGILIFCSNDLRVAEYAASLFHAGHGAWICPSGGVGRLTYDLFHKSEAEAFSEILTQHGVPASVIFPETRATNSAENTFFSRDLITKNDLPHDALMVLQKPYMERRTLATLTHYWKDQAFFVSSPDIPFDEYPFSGFSRSDLIHVLVGEFQRMILYAERGWQSPQPLPGELFESFDFLVSAGYTAQLADTSALPSKPPDTR